MKTIDNTGILASLSWHQHQWAGEPDTVDTTRSKFSFVQEHGTLFESLTFGHKKYPCEKNGFYIGYTPTFQSRRPDERNGRNVKILFFRSLNPQKKQMYIVGCYAFPEIGQFEKQAKHQLYDFYSWGNIKADPSNIAIFARPVLITNDLAQQNKYIPPNRKISQRGWNYLHSANVFNILDAAIKNNSTDQSIQSIKNRIIKILG